MILIDKPGHMVTDSHIDELFAFAAALGMKRAWFQDHPRHPHYDVFSERLKKLAVSRGAIQVSSRDIVRNSKSKIQNSKLHLSKVQNRLRNRIHPNLRVIREL